MLKYFSKYYQMENELEINEVVAIEHQGDALDWVCKKYEKEDLLSIMWVKTDEDGSHHFKIILRSNKTSKSQ
jgi:hypothetical protein